MTDPISAQLRDTAQGIANNLGGITHDGFDVSDQCREAADHIDAQDAKIKAMVEALEIAKASLDGEPEYHEQGMGCGLEDRNITDRYDAMSFGWEGAMERVYSEHINDAKEVMDAALAAAKEPT